MVKILVFNWERGFYTNRPADARLCLLFFRKAFGGPDEKAGQV